MERSNASQARGRRELLAGGGLATAAMLAGGALVGASPAAAEDLSFAYVPVGPFRVYDTRDGDGRIFRNEQWTLSGAAEPGELGHMYNLTVTETAGAAGYLSIFPGDIAWPGSSSINWFGPGQTLANNAYTLLGDPDGSINVLCGGPSGASTHFVLDLCAVLVLVDLDSVATTLRTASASQRSLRVVDKH